MQKRDELICHGKFEDELFTSCSCLIQELTHGRGSSLLGPAADGDEKLCHLLQRETQGLHATDEEQTLDVLAGVQPKPPLAAPRGRDEIDLVVVAQGPKGQPGLLGHRSDVNQLC